ncbi:MAG: uncharacterized membrane protein YgaE (UPF0421/DUF939 family) [Francisellaceae bacterium]|jgi:uncharacterized membrane protein YgaE (UPF0421/DUF939 family)
MSWIAQIFLPQERKKLWDAVVDEIKSYSITGSQSRFAIRVASAVTLSVLIAWLIELPETYWCAISAVVASQGTLGGTISKAMMRFIGTVVGGFAGLICNLLFSQNLILYMFFGSMLCIIPFYFREIDQKFSYAWTLTAVTAIIVMFGGISAATPDPQTFYSIFFYRVSEVSLGILVSTLCAYFIFPDLSAKIARKKLILIYANWDVLINKLFDAFNGNKNKTDFDNIYYKQANEINSLFDLLQAIKQESKFKKIKLPYSGLEQCARELDESIVYCYDKLSGSPSVYDFDKLSTEMSKIFSMILSQFKQKRFNFIESDFVEIQRLIDEHRLELIKIQTRDSKSLARALLFISNSFKQLYALKEINIHKDETIFQHLKKIILYEGITHFDIKNIKNAVVAGVMVYLAPLFWASIGWLDYSQIAITIFICLTLNQTSSKFKGVQRLSGCFIGAIVTLFILGLNIQNYIFMCIAIFIAMYIFQYFMAGNNKISYFGLQASIPLALGLVYGLTPVFTVEPAIDRLASIFIGVLTVIVIEMIINTETPLTLIKHNVYQARKSLIKSLSALKNSDLLHDHQTIYNLWRLRTSLVNLKKIHCDEIELERFSQIAITSLRDIYHCVYHVNLYYSKENYDPDADYIEVLDKIIELLSCYELSMCELRRHVKLAKLISDQSKIASLEDIHSYKKEILSRIAQHMYSYLDSIYKIRSYEYRSSSKSKRLAHINK